MNKKETSNPKDPRKQNFEPNKLNESAISKKKKDINGEESKYEGFLL